MSHIPHDFQVITDPLTATRVVLVPLAKGKGYAKIDEEDLLRLISDGYSPRWFLNDNGSLTEYVCLFHGTNNKKVARLVMNPSKGHVVRYANGDRKDLRKSNLVLRTRLELKKANLGSSARHG